MEPSVIDPELRRCLDIFNHIATYKGRRQASEMFSNLAELLQNEGIPAATKPITPYINSIDEKEEPAYPGNLDLETKIESLCRWNAMAMVVSANREEDGIGGHISTYASSAVLYEVGFNHFFKGNGDGFYGDQIFFQGHASPGNYARSFLEGRLSENNLHNFRRELAKEGGLSSYPHPYLMPTYWQFPTVSMGLGPILSIMQARFNRYMLSRKFIDHDPKVWCFVGDGESDEPETLGGLSLAGRENLDNLIFLVNCNLQRLDGPVRGNGKIIQELEAVFRGAGWKVIKVIWGSEWDSLLRSKHRDLLIKRMEEVVDGEYQKYTVMPGSYMRKHFFGKYPELYELVNHLTDDQIKHLLIRGGHDPKKIYAAYKEATEHKGSPVVILAKTVKGYGMGEAGEGKNISHQQKKLNEKELREFKERFDIPIKDEKLVETPFYKPKPSSPEMTYLKQQRKKLGGHLPERKRAKAAFEFPEADFYAEFAKGSGESKVSTTMSAVRILMKMLRHKGISKHLVPIIPDEGRTFGMEPLFRQIGIYSSKGQLYEPVDSESLLYYKEDKDGQLLEEGINEAGAMCSFIAAGTSYSSLGIPMIPFYIYYSMFGFQRVGDLMWLAGDIRAKGFLWGGTAGRTTLNGEGLQHQDGHSHVLASTIPSCMAYDPAFTFEIAALIEYGLDHMYVQDKDVYYYLTVGNENYAMPPQPKTATKEGIINGLYKFKKSTSKQKLKAHIFGSGAIILSALKAQEILEKDYGVSVDVWSATSYKKLKNDALNCQRQNMLNPAKKEKKSYIEKTLEKESGIFVSVSDNMRMVAEQVRPWVPGPYLVLGTDGFGRSESREKLRHFFEVDAEFTVIAVLYQLSKEGQLDKKVVTKAIKDLGIDPNKVYPVFG